MTGLFSVHHPTPQRYGPQPQKGFSSSLVHRAHGPKLISIGFSRVPYQFEKFQRPMEMTKRHFALPDKTALPLRPMKEEDVPKVCGGGGVSWRASPTLFSPGAGLQGPTLAMNLSERGIGICRISMQVGWNPLERIQMCLQLPPCPSHFIDCTTG